MGDLYEGRIGYHGNIQLKKRGEEEAGSLIMWHVMLEL